jgi:WD40 repeat protein
VAVTPDGKTAVSGALDQTVRVWDPANGRCTATLAAGSEEARRAWATADSDRVAATVVEPHGLTLRDSRSGTVLARFPGTFTVAACSADGQYVVAGDGRGGVYILRLHTRQG